VNKKLIRVRSLMGFKKRKKNFRKSKLSGVWFVLLSIFIVELFSYTWCRVQCVRVGYEITKEINNNQNLITLQNNLKIELARLKSPKRLAEIASHKLNLTRPTPKQVIIIP
jgi:cell division protein FtsL